jgi:ribose 5-phosphate isomerase B
MKVAIAGDHAGFPLKQWLVGELQKLGYDITDLGAHDLSPSDYPDFARALGRVVVAREAQRGILVCGSGVGACVAANKIKGIRAGHVHDTYSAHQGVEHDDINVLCLGARVIGTALALEVTQAFLQATFSKEERHVGRLKKVLAIEAQQR